MSAAAPQRGRRIPPRRERRPSLNVLFITFYFPPMPDVAALRTVELCRGLLVAGHDVTVVTSDGGPAELTLPGDNPPAAGTNAHGTLCVQRVRSWWKGLHGGPSVRKAAGWRGKSWAVVNRLSNRLLTFLGFDGVVPWALAAWWAVRRDATYDCVLVSVGPFSTLLTAYAIARGGRTPLVYDYRDVWNGTPYIRRRCSTRWLEQLLLARAALVVSISPACLSAIVGRSKAPATVVTNGIGEDVRRMAAERLVREGSHLVYAGAFYPPKRSFEPIAAALSLLQQSGTTPLRFTYLGPSSSYVRDVAKSHDVEALVDTRGCVSRQDSLIAQADSRCVVVVTSVEPSCGLADKGIVTGKIFEAIALAPRVLVISPIESDVRAMTAHLPHVQHFHGGQVTAIADWLATIEATAPAACPTESAWREFGWPYLARRFVTHVEQAVGVMPTVDSEQVHD